MPRKSYLLTLLLIAGCSSPAIDVEPAELVFNASDITQQNYDEAFMVLVDSAEIASKALRDLASIANGEATLTMTQDEYDEYIFQRDYIPPGMEMGVPLAYRGDFYPVMEMLASLTGYTLAPSLDRPPRPMPVSIHTTDEVTPVEIIRRINDVHDDKMFIKIVPALKVIEIEYY